MTEREKEIAKILNTQENYKGMQLKQKYL